MLKLAFCSFPVLGFSAATCLWVTAVQAAPPEVTGLLPSGGQRGTEVRVELQGKIDASAVQLWTETPGIELLAADGKKAVKIRLADDAPLGVAWLAFQNDEGVSSLRPFEIGAFAEVLEKEPNNDLSATETPLALPMVVNGSLQKAGDVDAVPVELAVGQTLTAVVEGHRLLGSPMDASLQIVDGRGFVLAQNDDARSFDPVLTFTATKPGRYFVRIFAFPATPDSSIRFSGAETYIYRLKLSSGPTVSRWQPAAITVNTPQAVVGLGANLPVEGWPTNVTSPQLDFFTPAGADVFVTSPLQVVPEPVVQAEPSNSAASPQAVDWPVCLSGVLPQQKSTNGWQISGKKSQRLRFALSTSALNSPVDALLQIYDSTGKRLLEVDDAKKESYEIASEFTLPADGTYRVVVGDRFWHGGPDSVYTLRIVAAKPTAVLSVSQSTWNFTSGKPLEIPVTIDRQTGFKAEFPIRIEGLPPGLTVEPVVSAAKGDAAKSVKLICQGEVNEPWTGQIRVAGEVAEADGTVVAATVTPPEGQVSAPFLLLRAVPAAKAK